MPAVRRQMKWNRRGRLMTSENMYIRYIRRDDVATTLARPRLPNRVLLSFGESSAPLPLPSLSPLVPVKTERSQRVYRAHALFLSRPLLLSHHGISRRVINVLLSIPSRNNISSSRCVSNTGAYIKLYRTYIILPFDI